MVPPTVAAFRARYRAEKIGPRYSGVAHLIFTSVACLSIIVAVCRGVRSPSLLEWLTLPLTFLFANFAEYTGHKLRMHRPRPPFVAVYRRHTVEHHHYFTHEAMAYESPRDFKMVLFPWFVIAFFFGLFALPVGALLWLVATPNVARLFVAGGVGYYLLYEWLHFSYHLDGELPLVGFLRRHHTTHHDQALMGKWNFNLTLPIFDLLLGTYYRGLEVADPRTRVRKPNGETGQTP